LKANCVFRTPLEPTSIHNLKKLEFWLALLPLNSWNTRCVKFFRRAISRGRQVLSQDVFG